MQKRKDAEGAMELTDDKEGLHIGASSGRVKMSVRG